MVAHAAAEGIEAVLLTPADVRGVAQVVGDGRYTTEVLTRELSAGSPYRWVGIRSGDGPLVGAHRALEWGDYLFLKGVFVASAERGSDIALRMAFMLRTMAHREGKRGIAAWVSAGSPAQLVLARRLRLKKASAPLHLHAVPVTEPASGCETAWSQAVWKAEETIGAHRADVGEDALVPELFSGAWRPLPDRDRLLLGGLPCATSGRLANLLRDLEPHVIEIGLSAIEFPVPAADIALGLWLAGRDAMRVSQHPVYVARLEFDHAEEKRSRHDATRS